MKDALCALAATFGMYSRLPMPHIEWTEKSISLMMGLFPLVGVVEALLVGMSLWALERLGASSILFGVVATAIPVLFTGGIHLDGFCDTVDALASHQPQEKKLEILRDSHSGAFAVSYCVLLFLVNFGCWAELAQDLPSALVLCGGFVLARVLSATSVLCFAKARQGTAATFGATPCKQQCLLLLALWGALSLVLMAWADLALTAFLAAVACGVFVLYRRVSVKEFGGITGDLAGWFLCLSNCAMAAGAALFILAKGAFLWF